MRCSWGTSSRQGVTGEALRRACVGAALLGATAACGDRPSGPDAVALDGRRIDGSLTVVSRITDPASGLPRAVWMDSSTFSAEMRDGIAVTKGVQLGGSRAGGVGGGRPLMSDARSGEEELELVVAQGKGSARQGTWRRRAKGGSGAVREVELAARRGEPISERTIYENGIPVVKVVESWERQGTGWLLRERHVIAYRNGIVAGSLTIRVSATVGELAARPWSPQHMSVAVADVLAPAFDLVARAMTPAALYAAGACEQEVLRMDDATENYLYATILLGLSLLSGNPFAVAAAAVNELKAGREMDKAEQALDDCVASA